MTVYLFIFSYLDAVYRQAETVNPYPLSTGREIVSGNPGRSVVPGSGLATRPRLSLKRRIDLTPIRDARKSFNLFRLSSHKGPLTGGLNGISTMP
jgi:hypothetical protein